MKRLFFAFAALVLATVAPGFAADTADWQTHIAIPVTVTDKGEHVSGLSTTDFDLSGPKGGKVTEAREVPPYLTADHKKALIFVFDTLGNPTAMQNPGRTAILRYLAQAVSERQPIFVFEITEKGPRLIHNTSTPAPITLAALKKLDHDTKLFQGQFHYSFDENAAKQASSDVDAEYQRLKEFLKEVHSAPTFNLLADQLVTFQSIGNMMAPVSGRKILLWFSSYFPLTVDQGQQRMAVLGNFMEDTPESRELSVQYEKAVRMLNKAAISVFPVQLDRTGMELAGGVEGRDTFTGFNDFAIRTGGQVVSYDTNVTPTVAMADRECGSYYLLDYDVPETQRIEWHGLGLKINKPNLTIHKPDGIFTIPPQKDKK
jgi:VWFA-related protein